MEKFSGKAKIFYNEFIRKPQPMTDKSLLLRQIRETSERLNAAHSRFENECDEDLVDSIIYEIHSLKALYRYLLKWRRKRVCNVRRFPFSAGR